MNILDDLEAKLAAATPGVWYAGGIDCGCVAMGPRSIAVCIDYTTGEGILNAALIVTMRANLPKLLRLARAATAVACDDLHEILTVDWFEFRAAIADLTKQV